MRTNPNILALSLLALIFISSCSRLEPTCTAIKTGHFFYYSKMLKDKILVERNDSAQLESRDNKVVSKSRISWKTNCSYEMFVNSLNDNLSEKDSIISSIPLQVEIITITKDYYVCKSTMKRTDMSLEMKDTLYFVK